MGNPVKRKGVFWAYPTSPSAKEYGFNETGCWTVEIMADGFEPLAIAGFGGMDEAITYAESKYPNLPWSRYSMHETSPQE